MGGRRAGGAPLLLIGRGFVLRLLEQVRVVLDIVIVERGGPGAEDSLVHLGPPQARCADSGEDAEAAAPHVVARQRGGGDEVLQLLRGNQRLAVDRGLLVAVLKQPRVAPRKDVEEAELRRPAVPVPHGPRVHVPDAQVHVPEERLGHLVLQRLFLDLRVPVDNDCQEEVEERQGAKQHVADLRAGLSVSLLAEATEGRF
mmetsp:Transcript_39734/g.94360  ORF Transcript_39734/g.94360 Transcript_39734/m.94360 type:complete len:200 (-) Transcript_39734:2129-2728(-)